MKRDMHRKREGWSWGRGLFLRDIPIAVESPGGPWWVGGGRVPGSPETGGAQTQGTPSLESESLVHSSKRGLGEIKGGTS